MLIASRIDGIDISRRVEEWEEDRQELKKRLQSIESKINFIATFSERFGTPLRIISLGSYGSYYEESTYSTNNPRLADRVEFYRFKLYSDECLASKRFHTESALTHTYTVTTKDYEKRLVDMVCVIVPIPSFSNKGSEEFSGILCIPDMEIFREEIESKKTAIAVFEHWLKQDNSGWDLTEDNRDKVAEDLSKRGYNENIIDEIKTIHLDQFF